jgi:hypothetical protein
LDFYTPTSFPQATRAIIMRIFCIIPNKYIPSDPMIFGESKGRINTEYWYNISSFDSDNDDIYFFIEWGDNTTSDWIGPYTSGINTSLNHSWSEEGNYLIRAKAKDEFGRESNWTTLEVSMPKTKSVNNFSPWLIRLIQRFPILELLL